MLQQIREKFTGWVALLILGVIAVTFVFVGGANFAVLGGSYAAKVNGEEVSTAAFDRAYRNQLAQNPSWADLPEQYRVQIRQRILDMLVRDQLVDQYLADNGYRISDEQLIRTVQQIPDFQVDGRFDRQTYESVLLQNGYTPAQFEAAQRNAMREDQLRRAIGATAIVTPAEYRRYLNLVAEQRLVSLAEFDLESSASEVEVTDEMITAFYEANDTLFLTPETADIQYIEIRRDAIASDIEIAEEELEQYYLEEQSRYLQDEQRRARHILILFGDDEEAAEAEARALLERVRAGEPFADLARTHSDDSGTAAQGGDLGMLPRTQLPGELGAAIFSMQEGDVEGPIKTEFGYHVVRLDEVVEPGPLPLEQVRGELLTELREAEAEDAFLELESELSDALFDTSDMEAIAAATGLELQSATGFTRSGGEPFGSNQAVIDAVFDPAVYEDGLVSDIVELDANRSAIFKVVDKQPAARRPLQEVRDEIVATMRTEAAKNIVFDRAGQLLAAVEAGEDFAAAAEAAGATVSEPRLIGRDAEDIDQAVVFQVFMADKPNMEGPVVGQVATSDGGYTVYAIDAVLPGRPETIATPERDAGKVQLAQQSGAAAYSAFVQSLYANADVVVNEDLLAASDLLQ